MKRILSASLCLLSFLWVGAQNPGDSIWVNSFDYSMTYGSGERDTVLNFPTDPSSSFEKILLFYSMRCKDGKVSPPIAGQTNIGCGEWDYSCNTYIIDSSRADSIPRSTSSHRISDFTGSSFDFVPNPLIDFHKKYYTSTTVNSITSETQSNIAFNTQSLNTAFPLQHYNSKSQFIYTAADLATAGLTGPGNIDGIFLFPSNTISADLAKIKIKHASTGQNSLETVESGGWTEVFSDELNLYAFPSGQRIMFSTPFYWDGSSAIIMEFSYTNPTGNGGFTLPMMEGHSTSYHSAAYSSGDQHPYFNGQNHLLIPGYKGIGGSSARTIEAWIKSDVPNKEIVSWGSNNTGEKWIVRINGNGTLRTEVNGGYIYGTTAIDDDQWHHVACVLDGTDVSDIKLYVDGNLESVGGQANKGINTDNTQGWDVSIGWGHNNAHFEGNIDNVRIWSTAVDPADISSWMHKTIDATHPDFSDLELDLHGDSLSTSGTEWPDASVQGRDASIVGGLYMQREEGEKIQKNFEINSNRPDIGFLQGTYVLSHSLDSLWYQVPQVPNNVQFMSIIDHSGSIMSDEVVSDSLAYLWDVSNGNRYYDTSGTLVNTTTLSPWGNISMAELSYWYRSPMALEIMSFVTPYGINLDLGMEGKTWIFDVTDFAPVLNGNRRLIMNKGGQWQEDMDLKFLFVYGTPPRNVLDISNIWHSNRSSTFSDIHSDKVFAPRYVQLIHTADKYKIRSSISGHGQQGEFIPRNHTLSLGASSLNTWEVWKTCGSNPIYPQGGTWIYDRAGWCPGMATNIVETEIPLSGSSNYLLDYHMPTASGDSRYIVSHEVVSYGPANHVLDARIADIISPSTYVEHIRMNPSCAGPKIVLQNTGSSTLSSAKIRYWINNSTTKEEFLWNGSLEMMDTTHVFLPETTDLYRSIVSTGGNVMHCEVVEANGQTDEYSLNNNFSSPFELPKVYPGDLVLLVKTNSAPSETEYRITDPSGNVLFSRIYTTPNKMIFDTVSGIGRGCYRLEVLDSDGDGINFWASPDGAGSLRLLSQTNGVLESFDGDFGNGFRVDFTVDWPLSFEDVQRLWEVVVFPNPSDKQVRIIAKDIGDAEIIVSNVMGQQMPLNYTDRSSSEVGLNVEAWAPGLYSILLKNGKRRSVQKFIKN